MNQARCCCIGNVIVSQEAPGNGVATFILETMTALAFDCYDATEVEISRFNENTAGLLLYPRLGFLPFAVEEGVFLDSHRSALIHMTPSRGGSTIILTLKARLMQLLPGFQSAALFLVCQCWMGSPVQSRNQGVELPDTYIVSSEHRNEI